MPPSWSTSAAISPSWPQGARTRTRSSSLGSALTLSPPGGTLRCEKLWLPGEDTLEVCERGADLDTPGPEGELANRLLVSAGAFLHHRDRLPHPPARLEVTEEQDRVGDVAQVQ